MDYDPLFNRPISKENIVRSVSYIIQSQNVSPIMLMRAVKIGYTKAVRIIAILQAAGVVTAPAPGKPQTVILKNETTALNAALRRFNKGKRGK